MGIKRELKQGTGQAGKMNNNGWIMRPLDKETVGNKDNNMGVVSLFR